MSTEHHPRGHDPESIKRVDKVINSFARTTEEIFSLDELREKLSSGQQLRMKYGVDVTAPDLHIGHAVNLWMYRQLQEVGHKVIFLIGDFTTQIGDPTGRNKLRPIVPAKEIEANSEAFIKQALMILHDDPDLLEIRRNSEWYNQMSARELLALMSLLTHDRLIGRDMFQKRIAEGKEIYENEVVYPLLQAYDSVALKADLTIIGSDQLFNEMVGRSFQEKFGQTPQVIITTKITPGIDGKGKQSKSLGNYVGLSHSPREKFGRIMSMPDRLIVDYFKVYTEVPLQEIAEIEQGLSSDPMKYKLMLAKEIVRRYHGEENAIAETAWFKGTFSERKSPKEMPVIRLGKSSATVLEIIQECLQGKSRSEIKRLVKQGAVEVDDQVAQDTGEVITLPKKGVKVRVGKRGWFRIIPEVEKGGEKG